MKEILCRCVIFGLLSAKSPAFAEVHESASTILAKVGAGVVKVHTKKQGQQFTSATGFVFPDTEHVVTCLHVVALADEILLDFQDPLRTRPATIDRFTKENDLALLRVINSPANSMVLKTSKTGPRPGEPLCIVGFQRNVASIQSVDAKKRIIGGNTLETIVPEDVQKLLQRNRSPAPDLKILDIEGSAVPGHSGAPVFNSEGLIVGITNGGLDKGVGAAAWAIPSDNLDLLLKASRTENLPDSQASLLPILFAMEFSERPNQPEGLGDLIALPPRPLADLESTVEWPTSYRNAFAPMARLYPQNFMRRWMFEGALHRPTGARLVFPAGAKISATQHGYGVDLSRWASEIRYWVTNSSDPKQRAVVKAEPERWLFEQYPGITWDPQNFERTLIPKAGSSGTRVTHRIMFGKSGIGTSDVAFFASIEKGDSLISTISVSLDTYRGATPAPGDLPDRRIGQFEAMLSAYLSYIRLPEDRSMSLSTTP